MLKYTKVNMVDVGDWDFLVQKTYGRTYSFQQQDGCKSRGVATFQVPIKNTWDYENSEIPEDVNGDEMGVSFKSWIERNPSQPIKDQKYEYQLDLFWQRNFYPSLEMVAQDLYEKGLIPAGEYTINIDW